MQCIQFCTAVTKVQRDANDNAWLVFTKHTRTNREETRRFGKVVLAIGPYGSKSQPKIAGMEKFTGDIVHSQQLKSLSKYVGQNVLVVGAGPTGVDTLSFLEDIGAGRLYLSLRSELTIVSSAINQRS
jgi:dimethylaniline monooxygenase (N-oxide forming)